MGNKPQKSVISTLLQPLPQSYIESSNGPHILMHSQLTSIRPYLILLNSEEEQTCIDSLTFRLAHKQQLIQIEYGEILKNEKEYKKIKVYVENIVYSLQNFIHIHLRDLLQIFYQVFLGFRLLMGKFGYFVPEPKMIGFNQAGSVKIWCNIKYTKAKPQLPYTLLNQTKVVAMLIQMFSSKVDINTVPLDVHTSRRKFHIQANTFDEAIQFIQQQLATVQIPNHIEGIVRFMQSGVKVEDGQIISLNSQSSNYHHTSPKFQRSPNANNKQKVNFSFNGQPTTNKHIVQGLQTPKRTSTSLPKITFSAGNVSTEAKTLRKKYENSEDLSQATSRVEYREREGLNMNVNANANVSSSGGYMQKGNGGDNNGGKQRTTSLVKFTYK